MAAALLKMKVMDPLHATIEEFAAEGYTHIECFCPRCRIIRLRPMSWLPKISMGLTLAQLLRAATLCRVRWTVAVGQAVATGGRAREAAGAKRLKKLSAGSRVVTLSLGALLPSVSRHALAIWKPGRPRPVSFLSQREKGSRIHLRDKVLSSP